MIARSKALASFESRLPDFFSLRLSLRLSQRRCSLCSLSSATSSNRARHSAAVLRCNWATSPAFAALGTSGSGELNLCADLHPSQVHHRHGSQTQMNSPASTSLLHTSQVPRSPPGPKYAIDAASPCPRPQRHPVTIMSGLGSGLPLFPERPSAFERSFPQTTLQRGKDSCCRFFLPG